MTSGFFVICSLFGYLSSILFIIYHGFEIQGIPRACRSPLKSDPTRGVSFEFFLRLGIEGFLFNYIRKLRRSKKEKVIAILNKPYHIVLSEPVRIASGNDIKALIVKAVY